MNNIESSTGEIVMYQAKFAYMGHDGLQLYEVTHNNANNAKQA